MADGWNGIPCNAHNVEITDSTSVSAIIKYITKEDCYCVMVKLLKDFGIIATKGDTVKMPFVVTNNDGSVYQVQDDDVINFGLKEKYEDAECLIEKTIDNDTLTLVLSHEDTKDLKVGIGYKYDIQIIRNTDEVHTFISGIITFTNEVYDKEN